MLEENSQKKQQHSVQSTPQRKIICQFLNWLETCRGSMPSTRRKYNRYAGRFLDLLDESGKKFEDLTGETVVQTFLSFSGSNGPGAVHSMWTALRTFFRFCFCQKHLSLDLGLVLPTPRHYTQAKVPEGIETDQVQRLLDSIDTETKADLRDRAILQILSTYGVRGGQVSALSLDDIDWRQSTIHFPAHKRGKGVTLPLSDEVGNCILDYLQRARPQIRSHEVFGTLVKPHRPITRHVVSNVVKSRLKKAGISCRPRGSHAFRYCFATKMLGCGQSLKTIADMLGHRDLSATFRYAKIDFQALDCVALDWPEVIS